MARVAQDSFEDDEDDDYASAPSDREDPDPSDQDPDDEDATDETDHCPYCGKAVYHGAEICPHCKNFISREDAPRRRVPWWFWLGLALCLLAALLWSV